MTAFSVALPGLHLLCVTLWLGSLLYTEWILWPHLLSAIIVIATAVWWLHFPTRDRKLGWRLYYPSFAAIFPLMIALRFHAPRFHAPH